MRNDQTRNRGKVTQRFGYLVHDEGFSSAPVGVEADDRRGADSLEDEHRQHEGVVQVAHMVLAGLVIGGALLRPHE